MPPEDETDEPIRAPLLSEKEIATIRETARKKVEAELKKAAETKALNAEMDRLRTEAGANGNEHLAGALSEMVDITIDLPEWAPCIQVNMPNGPRYYPGQSYRVPRHVANSLNETMQRTRDHDSEVNGKSKLRQRPRDIRINGVTGARQGAEGLRV